MADVNIPLRSSRCRKQAIIDTSAKIVLPVLYFSNLELDSTARTASKVPSLSIEHAWQRPRWKFLVCNESTSVPLGARPANPESEVLELNSIRWNSSPAPHAPANEWSGAWHRNDCSHSLPVDRSMSFYNWVASSRFHLQLKLKPMTARRKNQLTFYEPVRTLLWSNLVICSTLLQTFPKI